MAVQPTLTLGTKICASLSQLEVAHQQQRREIEADFALRMARMVQEKDDLRRQVSSKT